MHVNGLMLILTPQQVEEILICNGHVKPEQITNVRFARRKVVFTRHREDGSSQDMSVYFFVDGEFIRPTKPQIVSRAGGKESE